MSCIAATASVTSRPAESALVTAVSACERAAPASSAPFATEEAISRIAAVVSSREAAWCSARRARFSAASFIRPDCPSTDFACPCDVGHKGREPR